MRMNLAMTLSAVGNRGFGFDAARAQYPIPLNHLDIDPVAVGGAHPQLDFLAQRHDPGIPDVVVIVILLHGTANAAAVQKRALTTACRWVS